MAVAGILLTWSAASHAQTGEWGVPEDAVTFIELSSPAHDTAGRDHAPNDTALLDVFFGNTAVRPYYTTDGRPIIAIANETTKEWDSAPGNLEDRLVLIQDT